MKQFMIYVIALIIGSCLLIPAMSATESVKLSKITSENLKGGASGSMNAVAYSYEPVTLKNLQKAKDAKVQKKHPSAGGSIQFKHPGVIKLTDLKSKGTAQTSTAQKGTTPYVVKASCASY